uniref:RAD9 checkpoint clamp component A n=1 Tax=Mus musculus TaxID=10090 RepID=A0A494BAL0_MOUSE
MKCLITGGNVKVLGKAVHSLSRIGDELYLEPLKDGGWWTDIPAQFIISWVVRTSAWAQSSEAACLYRGSPYGL